MIVAVVDTYRTVLPPRPTSARPRIGVATSSGQRPQCDPAYCSLPVPPPTSIDDNLTQVVDETATSNLQSVACRQANRRNASSHGPGAERHRDAPSGLRSQGAPQANVFYYCSTQRTRTVIEASHQVRPSDST